MTLRSCHPNCEYCKTLWNWGFLDACFSNGIRVTDIDGFIERRDHYLVLETKKPSVTAIPVGQQRTFASMRRAGCFTVLVIFGHPGKPERVEVYYPIKGSRVHTNPTLETIQTIVRGWYHYANTTPPTPLQSAAKLVAMIEAFRLEQATPKRPVSIDRSLQASLILDLEAAA